MDFSPMPWAKGKMTTLPVNVLSMSAFRPLAAEPMSPMAAREYEVESPPDSVRASVSRMADSGEPEEPITRMLLAHDRPRGAGP